MSSVYCPLVHTGPTNRYPRFVFDVKMFDDNGNDLASIQMKEVDEEGRLVITETPLPHDFEITTTGGDNDEVKMCYSGECWTCPSDDGHGW